VRIAHADLVHVRQRALQVIDVVTTSALALGDECGRALDIKVAGELMMGLIGHECQRPYDAPATKARHDEPGQVNVVAHLAAPQRGEHVLPGANR